MRSTFPMTKARHTLGGAITLLTLGLSPSQAEPATTTPPEDAGQVDTAATSDSTDTETRFPPFTFTFFSENESAYYKPNDPSDRQYTAGNGILFHHQPTWAESLASHMPFADQFGPAETGTGYFAYHLIHTPNHLDTRAPLPNDRPYSGHFNFGAFWQRVDPERTTLDHFQLEVGFIGPSAAGKPIQKWIHEFFDAQEPMGWNNQLLTEPTFNVRVRKKWRAVYHRLGSTLDNLAFDIIPQVGFDAGTIHTDLNAQVTGRFGLNMPDDFGPAQLLDFGDATTGPPQRFGCYIFGSAAGSIVLHDIYLDGTVFQSSPVTVDSAPLMGTFRCGIQLAYAGDDWSVALGYAQTHRTEEFSTMTNPHVYGAWTMAVEIGF